ncbi:MAG: maleylpyruvate isomerase N-terminal domain-containing protein [Candidatus Rokubacteria bacterium]|nr:maleylpyruvate isomerase N-terminal domain-containing protein [Candidatus Rokubacteria bacterium]
MTAPRPDLRRAEIIEAYNRERDALLALVERIGAAVWDKPTACPGWSARDLIAHLATSATRLSTAVKMMLQGQQLNPTRADLDARNEAGVQERRSRSLKELIDELQTSHQRNIDLFLSLTDEQLAVTGALSSGDVITVMERFRRAGKHYREHGGMLAQVAGLGGG